MNTMPSILQRFTGGSMSSILLLCLATLLASSVAASGQPKDLDPKDYSPKSIKINLPATDSQIEQLEALIEEVAKEVAKDRAKKAAGETGRRIPIWKLYTELTNLISGYVGELIAHGNLCREAAIALAGVTGSTNRQKWTEVEITYVPKVGSSKQPVTVVAYVVFTAAREGGKIRIHMQDANGKILPDSEQECKNNKIPAQTSGF